MDFVNSSSATTSILAVNHIVCIKHEHSSPATTECTNNTMPMISHVTGANSPMSTKSFEIPRTSTQCYGPIVIRKRTIAAPTLATGRRSKDTTREGEDVVRREMRRKKNRESARNLRKLRDNIEDDLKTKVNELTLEEENLINKVNSLRAYKKYLEDRCQQIGVSNRSTARTISSDAERHISRIVPHGYVQPQHTKPKQEPRSPSPNQWQLSFCI